jgi:hypothetical protein
MNSYDISVKNRRVDSFYVGVNRGIKFLLFFIVAYWVVAGDSVEIPLHKVILLMVLFYLLDVLYPSCEINVIELQTKP